jgi:hypothetical protein
MTLKDSGLLGASQAILLTGLNAGYEKYIIDV